MTSVTLKPVICATRNCNQQLIMVKTAFKTSYNCTLRNSIIHCYRMQNISCGEVNLATDLKSSKCECFWLSTSGKEPSTAVLTLSWLIHRE
jgi:hypothetical protein